MRVLVLLLTYIAFGGCGGDSVSELSEPVPMVEDYKPPEPPPVKEAKALRRDLDSIRCYLLHEKEAEEGRAPKGWKQPSMEEYDKAKDPCSLLPGFVDPKKEEEEKKLEAEDPLRLGFGSSPIRR